MGGRSKGERRMSLGESHKRTEKHHSGRLVPAKPCPSWCEPGSLLLLAVKKMLPQGNKGPSSCLGSLLHSCRTPDFYRLSQGCALCKINSVTGFLRLCKLTPRGSASLSLNGSLEKIGCKSRIQFLSKYLSTHAASSPRLSPGSF